MDTRLAVLGAVLGVDMYMRSRAGYQTHDAPEGQLLQDPVPETALYVPPGHVVHAPSLEPVKPGLQVQSDKASLPGGEEDPAVMPSCQLAVCIASKSGKQLGIPQEHLSCCS